MRPLTWALKEVDPVDYQLLSLCLESLRNRMPSNLKLQITFKQKSIVKKKNWQEDAPPPLDNKVVCLSTPKHNGKSDTAAM